MEAFKKVLLIDDDDIVNSINKVIIKHAKFADDVVAITNASEAIGYLNNSIDSESFPDVIFLDLNMPEMNGWDFLDEFSKLEKRQVAKVIMLTSSISSKDQERALASKDVTAFLSKPLSPELLNNIYSNHLS